MLSMSKSITEPWVLFKNVSSYENSIYSLIIDLVYSRGKLKEFISQELIVTAKKIQSLVQHVTI